VPARQISGAVNRLAGKNVSQYINDFRIAEACRLLRETDMSVTAAMFELASRPSRTSIASFGVSPL
jgi:AraC-like DNA-binding protein